MTLSKKVSSVKNVKGSAPTREKHIFYINLLSTVKNAKEYAEASDKFIFCIDLLEISEQHVHADYWVNILEDNFDSINTSIKSRRKWND